MTKIHTLLLFLVPSIAVTAQTQTNNGTTNGGSLITVSQVESKEVEIEETESNDEGTNNPVITGSQEYIQGDKKYYLKKNENITILFEEQVP